MNLMAFDCQNPDLSVCDDQCVINFEGYLHFKMPDRM